MARSRFILDEADEEDEELEKTVETPIKKKQKQTPTTTKNLHFLTDPQQIQPGQTLDFFQKSGIITLVDEGSHYHVIIKKQDCFHVKLDKFDEKKLN